MMSVLVRTGIGIDRIDCSNRWLFASREGDDFILVAAVTAAFALENIVGLRWVIRVVAIPLL